MAPATDDDKKNYTYAVPRFLLCLGMPLVAAMIFSAVGVIYLYQAQHNPERFNGSPILLWFVPLIGASLLFWTSLFYVERLRPIATNPSGIATLTLGGHTRTVVRWNEIDQVTRMRTFDFFVSQNRDFFEIRAGRSRIYFDDLIQSHRELLETLNENIKRYDIDAFHVDRSSDALAEIRRTVSDPLERRNLLRSGRICRVTTF